MSKQTVMEAVIPKHDPIDEAMADVREARARFAGAKAALEQAESTLLARMLELEVARYDHVDAEGGSWSLSLSMPEQPSLRVKYLGKSE